MTREHTRSAGAGHTQEAGSAHYKVMKIQPIDYIEANELGFHEGNVVKYVTRWRSVDGLKDLEKAEWYIQRLIENAKQAALDAVQQKFNEARPPSGEAQFAEAEPEPETLAQRAIRNLEEDR